MHYVCNKYNLVPPLNVYSFDLAVHKEGHKGEHLLLALLLTYIYASH